MKRQPKVLIVEDELHNHPLFQTAYEEVGFTVKLCQTAEDDFVASVAAFAPDIIHMDLMIGQPGVEVRRDGFQAIELLKTDERTKSIPVIVVTNFFQEQKVRFARALGVKDFINLQGQPIQSIAARFKTYLDAPKRYQPSHPFFREE